MSASERRKGADFERECATRFNESGLSAERNLSQSRDGGYDLDTVAGAFECKRRHALPAYLRPPENVRGVIFAQDWGPRLVLLRLDDALNVLRLEHDRVVDQPAASFTEIP